MAVNLTWHEVYIAGFSTVTTGLGTGIGISVAIACGVKNAEQHAAANMAFFMSTGPGWSKAIEPNYPIQWELAAYAARE